MSDPACEPKKVLDYELAVAAVRVILDAAEALAEYDLSNADLAPAFRDLMGSADFWTVLQAANATLWQESGAYTHVSLMRPLPIPDWTRPE